MVGDIIRVCKKCGTQWLFAPAALIHWTKQVNRCPGCGKSGKFKQMRRDA